MGFIFKTIKSSKKRQKMLEDDFEAGKILKPDEDVDNKQLMKEKSNVSE